MSVETTRRGLFTLAVAAVGASTLVAAKPAEAPAPEFKAPGVPLWQLHYRLRVHAALAAQGLDPSLWTVEFEHDPVYMEDAVALSSRAYGDRLNYSKVRYGDRDALTPELATMQAQAMARNVWYIEQGEA